MPAVTRHPPRYAVQAIYMLPADYVLRDRFGAAVDEVAFLQVVENNLLLIRQWYWDVLGAGKTFNVTPAIIFRSQKTSAQIFAAYPYYNDACIGILAEMKANGQAFTESSNRLPNMYLPLDLDGGGNAIGAFGYGSPFSEYGAVVGAGSNGLLLGGQFLPFRSSIGSVRFDATATATNIQVAPGTGRDFALAARFRGDSTRVTVAPSNPTTGTTLTVADTAWMPGTFPFDAVLFPYGPALPSAANAESVQVTAVTGTGPYAVTFNRGRNGTTPIAIQGGGGTVIAQRQQTARIWTPPSQPEGTGFDVVKITNIVGDILVVQRNVDDAYSYLNGRGPARPILAGDQIAASAPQSLSFYQNARQASGAFAHELGHCFGMHHYTPDEARHYQSVGLVGASYVVTNRDLIAEGAIPNYGPLAGVVNGQDFWEHLRHTPLNPTTPGVFSPYVMYDYWDWPYGNVAAPAAGFSADEASRVLASPHLTTQPRPTAAGVATRSNILVSGTAAASQVPQSPVNTGYYVQPVMWWASDTSTDAANWPDYSSVPDLLQYTVPMSKDVMLQRWANTVLRARRFMYDHTTRYTFDAADPIYYQSPKTQDQIAADPNYAGFVGMKTFMTDLAAANSSIDLSNPKVIYWVTYFADGVRSDSLNLSGAITWSLDPGSNISSADNVQGPFVSAVCARPSTNPWARESISPGSSPTIPRETNLIILIHELCHALGWSPVTRNILRHPPNPGPNDLMNRTISWEDLADTNVNAESIDLWRASPWMSQRTTRP